MKGKQQDFRTEKYIRYGIRKYSFGAASVAIAAGLMFLGNGAVSATEQNPVSDSKENIQKVENSSPELGESNIQLVDMTTETPKKEEVKVNKSLLEASIATLESKLSTAKYANASVVANAREALATAKAVLANEAAKQEEINVQKEILSSLKTVVTESNKLGLEKEQADKDKAAKEEAERNATPTEKALSEAKSALDKVSSEADVTNTLAVTELRKKEVAEENRVAIEAAVAKNKAVLDESKMLLADKSVTKEQVDAQLARLNESILAVYSELKKAGIGRDGKFEVALADVAEKVDEAPLSEEEQANHWKKYAEKNTERLKHQIKWFDITSKNAVVENLDEGGKLKVGTKFKQELTPGYVVEMEVTALKPFNSTDVYKERGGAGYDPDAKNVYKDGTPAEVKVVRQGGYSVAKTNGIDTGGTTVIQSVKNGANVGVEFKVKATLNGKEVPANVVFATGEEAGSSEIEIYKTDGDGFELVTELSNTNYRVPTARSYTAESYDNRYNLSPVGNGQGRQLGQSYTIEGSGKDAFKPFIADKAKGFRSTEITEETVSTVTDTDGTVYSDGLGTQVFGPAVTHRDSGMSTPVVLTRNAKNLGVYILSSGQQGAMFGFMVLDEGDAPASYGKVAHAIAKGNGVKQPYLGSNAPDVDIRTEKITKENAFKYDDENGEGGDEGARQLMGDKVIATEKGDNYKLKKVNDGIYEMTVDAHLDGGDPAWVNGWIDFNNNGKFDENEAAGAVKVTSDGEVTLRWNTPVQNLDVTATKLATRLRIANDGADVKEATGIAYSGEVEDFEIQQTIPPRGSKETTIDIQGATQRANIKFNAYGHKAYDLDTDSKIDEEVKPQIVKPDGSIVTDAELVDGYYVVPGQGKYKITANGKDVDVEFVPEDSFVGDADGITIRRTDINGETTGWGKNGKTIINGEGENEDKLVPISEQVAPEGSIEKGTMDGRYIPRVMKREIIGKTEVSNDVQGSKQHKTPEFKDTAGNKISPSAEFPVKLVDPATNQPTDTTTIDAKKDGKKIGEYTITPSTGEIVFTPNKDFTGTPDPVTVSFDGKVGVDKDGRPVTSTGTSQYQPTVKPVTPTAENGETTKPQGETQEKEITFTAGKATVTYLDKNDETVEVEKSVPMNTAGYTLLAEDGVTPATEVPARKPDGTEIGKFTLKVVDGKPIAVFIPRDKTYVGDVLPVKIQGEDENGTKVTATYTPHITPVAPTAQPGESIAVQGATQKGAPIFTPGSENAPMKPETIKLLNDAGEEADELPAKDKKGKVVGTYTLDKTTGEVIFTPTDKTFVGKVLSARVQMADSNGTKVEATYTPKIVPVEPKGTAAESSKTQGLVQQGTVSFAPGKATVGDKEETVALKENSARLVGVDGQVLAPDAKLDVFAEDGKKIGEYTIDPTTNTVTYTPTDKTYTGEVPPAVVRAEDVNGSTAETTYTPNIIPVVPTATPAESTGIQGAIQTGTVAFKEGNPVIPIKANSAVLLDKEGNPVAPGTPVDAVEETGKKVGEYTIDLATNKVTFTPTNKSYIGKVQPAKVQAEDENGTKVSTTYTPTIVGVAPTAKESATVGKQGQAQTSQIVFDTPDTDATTLNFAKGETSEVLGEDGQPKSVALDKSTLTLLDANGNSVTTVTVDGEGTYTLDKTTNVITFQPTEEFTGKATPVRVQIADVNGTTVTTNYTPTVVAEDGTVIVEYKDEEGNIISPSTTPVNNEKVTTPFTTEPKEIPGYTLVKVETTNGMVDEATKKVSGKVTNEPTTVTYTYRKDVQTATISYYDVSTGAEVAIDSAKVPAAAVETVEGVYRGTIDFVHREKAIAALEKAGYTLVEDGFVAARTADKLFDNDTAVNQNFTVTVKQRVEPVTPNDEKPVPGQPVNPENPNSPVWPSTAENLELTKTVTRTIKYRYNDENGKEVTADKVQTVTFTRSASINLVTGNVEYTDWSAAQTLEAVVSPEVPNYTYDKKTIPSLEVTNESTDSTVYVIYTPVAPTTTPATSTDIQGKTQTGTPTYKHADGTELKPTTDNPAKFVGTEETTIPATKDGKTVGTYTIDPTGTVTFTPNKDFVGTPDPAKVVVTDLTNGTTVESSYTPTVTPVTPTGVDTGSTGPKNTPQSGTPTFVPGHKDVPMDNNVPARFEDGTTSKTVPNEGTYTVDATGKLTFTPNKDFVGTATGVTIVRKDTNGTVAKAKYTPTVYEVKSDIQVATVTYKDTNGTILGEVDILQGDSGSEMNYSTAERINALKKLGYELVSDEFTKADGSKQSFDNDTKAIQKFVVTVQPRLVPVIPSDVTPVPGQPIDPEDPNSPVWPESVKELTTSEEVTRTITYVDGDGKEVTTSVTSSVKFTRDAKVNLVTGEVTYGEWKEATTDVLSGNKLPFVKGYIAVSGDIEASTKDQTVKAEDKDIIQKVVYKKLGAWIPNVPGQTNPPRIDYPNDPNGDPTKPGVPTEDIVIPYVPGYIPRDKDGNPLKPVDPEDPTKGYVPPTLPTDPSQDTPINYTKITTSYVTVDSNGKEVSIPNYPREDGEQPKKDIPGYRFVETKKLPNGDTEHVYEKVNTFFKDKEGNEIPNYPSEPGTVDKKDIPEYRFVETKKLPNGDTEHVYEKVNTFFKDKEGNEIPNYPSEPGTVDKKDIPEYRFVETKKLPNGDTEHVYEKVNTFFKDKEGNEIPNYPSEPGTVDKKDIPEYRFVETKKLPNGDVEHVYEKVTPPAPTPSPVPQPNPGKQNTTTWTDENGNPLKPTEPGSKESGTIPGYEYVKTVTGSNGNIRHIFRKVEMPTPTPVEPVQPVSPQEPETPEQPVTSEMPTVPEQPKQPTTPKYVDGQKELPNTGTEANASLAALGLFGALSGFGLLSRKKKED